jgi:uncharacterized protein
VSTRPPVPFPRLELPEGGVQLGVGFDMSWGSGFVADPANGDRVASGPAQFLSRHRDVFSHVFVSWQPRSRAKLDVGDYTAAWDDLFVGLDGYPVRALHQTTLNLAASSAYDRREILALTNALVHRYDLRWVNEDLGLWSLDGRPLPYPLPPLLTDAGLAACIRNVVETVEGLDVPLLVEFPGFSAGWSLRVGGWDAYDFFREVVEQGGAACTLDVGHLLSWRWFIGHRGEALFGDLDRLPLDHCFEVHLSGIEISGERFVDAHHGVLIEAQFELLKRLRARCPNLRVITYEDPVFDEHGALDPGNQASLARLVEAVGAPVMPRSAPAVPEGPTRRGVESGRRSSGGSGEAGLGDAVPAADTGALECALDRVLRSPEDLEALHAGDDLGLSQAEAGDLRALPVPEVRALGREIRHQLAARRSLGQRPLRERFAKVFEAWDAAHPGDPDGLLTAFCAPPLGRDWAEVGFDGRPCIEAAFYGFVSARAWVPPEVLRAEYYSSLIDTLGVVGEPAFGVPSVVIGGPGRWLVVDEGPPCRLYAATKGRVIKGALPPLAAGVLTGLDDATLADRHQLPVSAIAPVRAKLAALGLLA